LTLARPRAAARVLAATFRAGGQLVRAGPLPLLAWAIIGNVYAMGAWWALAQWLQTTDFFTAPASASNHSNFEGGLAYHSLKVYEAMTANIFQLDPHYSPDSVKVVALLHDICKIHFYEIATRNVEKAPKCWVKVPYYKHAYPSPTLDHAVRSCRLIEKHMRLDDDEYLAIRWHMSAFSESDFEGRKCMAEAMRIPLVLALAQADQEASFLREEITR
jgi:hypothetical protein